ncbi:hypothetical protein NP493_1638g00017 [Ridgeia piscesae]|uniref:Reverse transcriptase domain-containing protein n=1 Tax=Ridgeia piscesae TaxID=27915 RepID=A0AAD9JWE9_RIDPI|nr:hypothetical protein NP493_1638g00017 [Ridgeia piscesae]
MQDVRVQRGADAASDHHLVLARMKMKLKKREVKRSTRTQYNVDFLKDRLTTETFRLTVRNKYEALQDLLDEGNMDIDTQWQQIKEMWTSTSRSSGKEEIPTKRRDFCRHSQQSASPDKIPAEAIKADIETSTEYCMIYWGRYGSKKKYQLNGKKVPREAPKKGDMQDCNNYRGIMLLSVPGKVLNRVILDRLKTGVDAKLRDHQAGFPKTDHAQTK